MHFATYSKKHKALYILQVVLSHHDNKTNTVWPEKQDNFTLFNSFGYEAKRYMPPKYFIDEQIFSFVHFH